MAGPTPNNEEQSREFLRFLEERRQVRSFSAQTPSREVLGLLLQAAATPPFWGGAPAWHLVAVDDPDVLAKVRKAATTGILNKMNFWIQRAPAVVVACVKAGGFSLRRLNAPVQAVDAALALERLSLMAHQSGLGTAVLAAFNERAVRRACQIPSGWRSLALLALGYPAGRKEPVLGVPVIEDFGQYYDLLRAKRERKSLVPRRPAVSYNRFAP